jgi:hypothetical protein
LSYISELQDAIKHLHGVESKTVWEGVVEVFELIGHPKARKVYAWAHDADGKRKRHITVLHLAPVNSPQAAVKAAIVQEFRLAQES